MTSTRLLCVAVDLEGFSRRSLAEQESAQDRIADLLDAAWLAGDVPADAITRRQTGDGELTLLDVAGAESEVLAAFIGALRAGLTAANGAAGPCHRMRLRVAAHAGSAVAGPNGFAGHAVIRTCRLVDCAPLHALLAENPDADLGLIVSDSLFEDVVSVGTGGALAAREFQPVLVVDAAKRFSAHAWLHIGGPANGATCAVHAREPAEPARLRIDIADGGHVGTILQVGEVHGGLSLGHVPRSPRP
ncbi:hypothetical protein [Pseudonocardia acidicola]|uniref:Uncharacterized protein n=1 Tax=Pseudonocardia acidicola TaxID=2724939 RepID=A0ABX1SGC0_9PSEU|nr:hypothetical protein [Pseudonocardia acidicola]NMI00612.1 hypothetical protein [Pseudonocardia acidicola]